MQSLIFPARFARASLAPARLALLCLAFAAGASAGGGASAAEPRRPNILVVMTDEHHAGVMGCAGDPRARTPHLDRLALEGVVFRAHYCASPICTPSRQTFTTGKYVSGHRVWSNTVGVPEGTPSLARILNAAGYESYLDGKMHYKGGMTHGYQIVQERDGSITPAKKPEDFPAKPSPTKPRRRLPAGVFADRGATVGEEFERAGEADPLDDFVDAARAKHAVKFLQERKPGGKPFFLTVGFIAPHYPLVAPEEMLAHFRDRVPAPEVSEEELKLLPLNYRHLRNDRRMERLPPALVKRALEGYYARVEWIDARIGEVLAALAASPFAEDTVVVYTSDHGENLGEHGLWWKNCMYDCGARTPLIVRWPARWRGGQERTAACGMVDLVQTIAALGGADVPNDWKGESMLPWLDDASHPWRDLAVSEYFGGYVASGFVMIRQGDWKYVYHARADEKHPPERELYHLPSDPGEIRNLADDPVRADRVAEMHAALVKETGCDPEATEAEYRAGIGPSPRAAAPPAAKPDASAAAAPEPLRRRLRAADVFDAKGKILFQDRFASGGLARWNFSEDDRYEIAQVDPARIAVVDAPGLGAGRKAVRFCVERAPDAFRAEISLPHEAGFQERWYGERIFVPEEWTFDHGRGNDIVLQWHAIPGDGKATFPNLELSIGGDRWHVRQSFGDPKTKPTRAAFKLEEPVRRGAWTSWVLHAKWSPRDDGLVQIWRDAKLVLERKGPNVYGTIGVEYTPYLKTGIYHPEWRVKDDASRKAFDAERPVATKKIVYVADAAVGDARAAYDDVAPPAAP